MPSGLPARLPPPVPTAPYAFLRLVDRRGRVGTPARGCLPLPFPLEWCRRPPGYAPLRGARFSRESAPAGPPEARRGNRRRLGPLGPPALRSIGHRGHRDDPPTGSPAGGIRQTPWLDRGRWPGLAPGLAPWDGRRGRRSDPRPFGSPGGGRRFRGDRPAGLERRGRRLAPVRRGASPTNPATVGEPAPRPFRDTV